MTTCIISQIIFLLFLTSSDYQIAESTYLGSLEGKDYYINTTRLKFDEHRSLCESKGQKLASVEQSIYDAFKYDLRVFEIELFIGAKCNTSRGIFNWNDGSDILIYNKFLFSERRCYTSDDVVVFDPLGPTAKPADPGRFIIKNRNFALAGSLCTEDQWSYLQYLNSFNASRQREGALHQAVHYSSEDINTTSLGPSTNFSTNLINSSHNGGENAQEEPAKRVSSSTLPASSSLEVTEMKDLLKSLILQIRQITRIP